MTRSPISSCAPPRKARPILGNGTSIASQKSAGIALTAGQRYAFECKLFQGYGGDNLAVGWLRPGQTGTVPSEIVPGSVLSNYVAPYNPPGLTTLYFGALTRLSGAPPAHRVSQI